LQLRGPVGVFTLPDPLEKDLFLICTGTGIAPFRSMSNAIKLQQKVHKNIHLIFGCRTQADLLYYDEFKQLEKDLDGFHYHPVLSREQWEGKSGYVHAVYEELCADKQPANFYLCGWKAMVDEARERIVALGYDKKEIHLELYG
jgi:NAD(P)H-flavin reductase